MLANRDVAASLAVEDVIFWPENTNPVEREISIFFNCRDKFLCRLDFLISLRAEFKQAQVIDCSMLKSQNV